MPNPIAHIDIALLSAAQLRHPVIDSNLGHFILGSCAPDIRAVTRGLRDDYHFAPLSNQVIGAGATNLFKAYPRLARDSGLPDPTRAFIAGYISHLVTDEAWIIQVYRPYFGNGELFPDRVVGNVMDRAVQLEMDREALKTHDGMQTIRGYLATSHIGVDVEFLPKEALSEWRERVEAFTERGFSWERLRPLANRRQDPQDRERAQAAAEQFLRTLPEGLERVHDLVPREAIRFFRETALLEWSKLAQEYLT